MRKWPIITTMLLVVGSSTFSSYVDAQDDITGHFFETQIRSLDELGIMKGDGKGLYMPNKNVTRAQFATFLNRALKLPAVEVEPFTDTMGHIHEKEIGNAVAAGVFGGIGDGSFLPDRDLTREEVAVIISRVLTSHGLTSEPMPLPFIDADKFKYPNEVQPVFAYSIMGGNSDLTFRPQESVTRAQTAAVIYKMYNLLEQIEKEKLEQDMVYDPDLDVDILDLDRETIVEEKDSSNRDKDRDNNQDHDRDSDEEGEDRPFNPIVIAKNLLHVYEDKVNSIKRTYVNAGTEMKFLDESKDEIKVEVAGVIGYVNKDEVELIGEDEAVRSYYKIDNDYLRHYVARNGQYESYIFGQVPSFFKGSDKEYSFDGKTFSKGTFYQYFNYLPLLTETSYSARELDEFVEEQYPASPLVRLGEFFKEVEEETGVNALYLLAHAIHESAWGFSQIATEKYNLYGLRAVDVDAFNSAMEFDSFEECIVYAANYIKDRYLTPGPSSYYSGSFLGNKGVGMNLFYASDPYWGQKISGYMYRIDRFLGGDDLDNYRLAISTVPSLNVRRGPSMDDKVIYEHKYAGIAMVVVDKEKTSDGTWYKIKSDHPDYEFGYIYANGEKGEFAEIIN